VAITITIPDSVAGGLQLPANEAERRLTTELAVALYAQGILSFGKARELAGLDRLGFADLLAQRGIPRHYGETELAQDLAYVGGE